MRDAVASVVHWMSQSDCFLRLPVIRVTVSASQSSRSCRRSHHPDHENDGGEIIDYGSTRLSHPLEADSAEGLHHDSFT